MPYKSDAQRRWAHTTIGKRALGEDVVREFDRATKNKSLPDKINKRKSALERRMKS